MKITSYKALGKLPDLFTFDDGAKVKNLADWERRRDELYKWAVELQYGEIPPEPEFLDIDPLCAPNVPGRMNIYRVTTGTRKCPVRFTLYAHIPDGKGPYPVAVDGDLCYTSMQDPEIARAFQEKGILLAAFNRCELVPDIRNPKRTGNLYETYPDKRFGALAAWAWGFSRTLDALVRLGLADLSCVAFTGLSRGGKAALLAGALDARATIVNPEGSGCGGSGCYRIHMRGVEEDGREARSETLKDIVNAFPDWFGPNLAAYQDDEAALPFDEHFLKALVAPRVYFDSQALSDMWAGPVNTWMTSVAAREAWKLYGKEENVLWYWRSGGHSHVLEDFRRLIEVIQRERTGAPLSEVFGKVPFETPELLFEWRCPE